MTDTTQILCPHCDAINRVPTPRLSEAPRCGACRAPLFAAQPLAVSEDGFRRQLRLSGIPLLVDFWASWCGPCRAMAPEFEKAAQQLEPQMRLLKVSTEEAPGLAQEYRITGIPALLLFAGGQERARRSGALPAGQIVAWARQAA